MQKQNVRLVLDTTDLNDYLLIVLLLVYCKYHLALNKCVIDHNRLKEVKYKHRHNPIHRRRHRLRHRHIGQMILSQPGRDHKLTFKNSRHGLLHQASRTTVIYWLGWALKRPLKKKEGSLDQIIS